MDYYNNGNVQYGNGQQNGYYGGPVQMNQSQGQQMYLTQTGQQQPQILQIQGQYPISQMNSQQYQSQATPQVQSQLSVQQESPLLSHPTQFWSRNNNSHCLFVSDNLCAPTEKDYCNNGGNELLMQLHSKFSRFQLSIFEYASKQYANYNLDPAKLAGFEKKMEALHVMQMMKKPSAEAESLSPAYTTVLTGKFKDTPANLLLAAQQAGNVQPVINDLAAQINFLAQNVAKYPKNQLQINAIQDAFNLLQSGQLVQKENTAGKIPILEDMKVPHAKKVDAQGFTNVVSCSISCNFANSYPICIEIMNGMAVPIIKDNGLTNANMSTLKNVKKFSYNLTLEDFDDMLAEMKAQKTIFEQENRLKRRRIAKDIEFKQRESQKQK